MKRRAVLVHGLPSFSGSNVYRFVTGLLKQHPRICRNTGSKFIYLKVWIHVNKKETHGKFENTNNYVNICVPELSI
jgi:hypothetical protein